VVQELDKLQAVRDLDPGTQGPTVGMWRSLSGMQHGHAYALVLNSIAHDEEEILGGRRQMVSISDNAFQTAAGAANLMVVNGMKLYIRRCTRP